MVAEHESARATSVEIVNRRLVAHLRDGRVISVPLFWYPTLFFATPEQRADFQVMNSGFGIHWPALDEDIRVGGMLEESAKPCPIRKCCLDLVLVQSYKNAMVEMLQLREANDADGEEESMEGLETLWGMMSDAQRMQIEAWLPSLNLKP